jgi:two-component system response regulator PilR (NtrC family)
LCANDTVSLDDLHLAADELVAQSGGGRGGETLDDYINRIEKQAILDALNKTAFNRTAAARLLGVSFRSLRYRIERLGIEE